MDGHSSFDRAKLGHTAEEPGSEAVRFLQQHDAYNAGEVGHFPPSVAEDLARRGIVELAAAPDAPPADKMVRGRAKKA